VVLGVEAADDRVGGGGVGHGQQPGGVADTEALGGGQAAQVTAPLREGVLRPEPGHLGLGRGVDRAVGAAEGLDLGQVAGVGVAPQAGGPVGAEPGRGPEGQGADLGQHDVDGWGGGDGLEHTGPGRRLHLRDLVVEAVAGPQPEDGRGDPVADLDAVGLAGPSGIPAR
jgi:hypothetical protein